MTPKGKAKQLVEKYTFSCRECDNAKQCAQMEVDALIEQNGELYLIKACKETISHYREKNAYLFEVKTELEKL